MCGSGRRSAGRDQQDHQGQDHQQQKREILEQDRDSAFNDGFHVVFDKEEQIECRGHCYLLFYAGFFFWYTRTQSIIMVAGKFF